MVMAQALFSLLQRHDPTVLVDVLAPAWTMPLLVRMPEVRQAITLEVGHGELKLRQRYHQARALRAEQYQQAIVLPNSFKSALVPYWANIPVRTGWRGEMRYHFINDLRILVKARYPRMIDRFMALGLPKGAPLPTEQVRPNLIVVPQDRQTAMVGLGLTDEQPILALCPGAEYGPAKRWPARYFAEIARTQVDQGWQVWIFGGPKDTVIAGKIQQHAGHICHNLTGRTSLGQAIDLLSLAKAVVCNDSGLMHIAAALNRPIVAVYGSSSPQFTPPLADRVSIQQVDIACSPCFKRHCPLAHQRCLYDLRPPQVLSALAEWG